MKNIVSPTQIIYEDVCRANIDRMLQKARHSGAVLRPHFKTHQSVEVGRWFREAGIDRIAVSSVSMAQQFAADGWMDIMIAFPVNFFEMDAINQLASRLKLGLLAASTGVISLLKKQLKHPVDLYIKVDVGTHRTGFDPYDTTLLDQELEQIPNTSRLRLKGLVAHAGHTYQAASHEEIHSIYRGGVQILTNIRERYNDRFPELVISWGDTPSCSVVEDLSQVDELRPGNFVYYDLMQWQLNACRLSNIGMVVAAPLVALHPGRNEAVVYAGAVHLSKEQLITRQGEKWYGIMVLLDDSGRWRLPEQQVWVHRLSQEHGILKVPPALFSQLQIGQMTGIIPVHSCLAADLLPKRLIV
jgi:D-serine deaminase-like pyridoxal phosphate-dependent protein